MPPKKVEAPKTMLLGRPGTHLKMGVVGLPNVGKSTFFNVLSKKSIPAENRPFCTIDPNNADINIPDARFDKLVATYKPASQVPAQLQIRDIAGLVRGAATGEGLGNAFLSHISEVDGIYHMCRVFDDMDIVHIEGEVDPVRDLEIIFNELVLKDIASVDFQIKKLAPIVARGADKTKQAGIDLTYLASFKEHLEAGKQIRCGSWNNKEIEYLNTLFLLTAKPAVFLVNMSIKDFSRQRNKWLPKLKAWIDEQTGEPMIPFSADLEKTLMTLTPEQQVEFLKENNNAKSMVTKLVTTGFETINLIYFFTSGTDEVKCWTIQKGFKAPQAAGRIHGDFEKGFICADVIHWKDFDELGDEVAVREEGKLMQQGRTYEVLDGDIIHFKFNVSKGGKK